MRIVSTERPLFARVEDVDLSKPLGDGAVSAVTSALGEHGVLCFPGQDLSSAQLRDFSARFGTLEINVGNLQKDTDYPEVMVLSNIVKDGKPIGVGDAGQDWHTDMSYSKTVAFVNVLFALEVPRKNGRTLGETHFSDMAAAWDALPQAVKATLEGRRIVHVIGVADLEAQKRIRALAITTKERHPDFPDLPTTDEAGFKGFDEYSPGIGLMAPAGTPPAIVEKISKAVQESLKNPATAEQLRKLGAVNAGLGPDEFGKWIRDDYARWERVIKAANIRND